MKILEVHLVNAIRSLDDVAKMTAYVKATDERPILVGRDADATHLNYVPAELRAGCVFVGDRAIPFHNVRELVVDHSAAIEIEAVAEALGAFAQKPAGIGEDADQRDEGAATVTTPDAAIPFHTPKPSKRRGRS